MNERRRAIVLVAIAGAVLGLAAGHGEGASPGARADRMAPSRAPAQARQPVPDVSAAYNALAPDLGATDVRLPLWRNAQGAARLTTAIAVVNVGATATPLTITFTDDSGTRLPCGSGCSVTLDVGEAHYFWPPDLKGVGDAVGTSGSARLTSRQPVVAIAHDLALADLADAAMYRGIAVGAKLPNPVKPHLPLLLHVLAPGAAPPDLSAVTAANLDASTPTTVTLALVAQPAGKPLEFVSPLVEPNASTTWSLLLPDVFEDFYAGTLAAPQPIGALVRSEWPGTGGAALHNAPYPGTDVTVPLVFAGSGRRCSLVAVQNTDLRAEITVDVEVLALGESKPVLTTVARIHPSASTTLDLCADERFAALGSPFVGSLAVHSAQTPVAVQAFVDVAGEHAVAAFDGVVAALAATEQHAPLLHRAWAPDGAAPDAPRLSSLVAVSNPGRTVASVVLTVLGLGGSCAGAQHTLGPLSVPPAASVTFDLAPGGDGKVPDDCLASGVVSADTRVHAVVLDEGFQPPATPTLVPPTDTASPTVTRTPTDTPWPTPTPSVTPSPRLSPTPTATARETATPSATASAVPTKTPPPTRFATMTQRATRTPPNATPLPTVTRVPPEGWRRLDSSNSILTFDRVRHLEIDRDGVAWLRLIDPAGGPDSVVRVRRDQKASPNDTWQTVRAGIRDAIAAIGAPEARKLRRVRDFFDVDEVNDRTWVGAEYFDGRAWRKVAEDERSPAGGVYYEQRTLVDADAHAWVPYGNRPDCVPPATCAVTGVRALDKAGQLLADIQVGGTAGASALGAQALLVTGRDRGPVVDAAAPAPSDPLRLIDPARLGARADAGGASSRRDTAQRPAGAAQTASSDWIVLPNAWYAPPDVTARSYPYLDPREFLSTGLRNAGYATAATLTPSGLLQVVTWVEIDSGTTVTPRIFLNTLVDDAWEVEDLTDTPLLDGTAAGRRVIGLTYCRDGGRSLWMVADDRTIGVRADGERADGRWTVYKPADGVLRSDEIVTDIDCGAAGDVWIGLRTGLIGYGLPAAPRRIFAPFAEAH